VSEVNMHTGTYDGPLAGLSPRLGLGTQAFAPERRAASLAVLDAWRSLGGRLVDTAHVYNAGASERLVGEWLRSTGARAETLILTKGGHPDADWHSRLDPASIASDVADSLQRLGIDTIDIYLLHRDDPTIPVGEIMDTLNEYVRAGSLRSIGASNWTPARVDQANAYAAARGLAGFSCISNYLGLATRIHEIWPGTLTATDRASRDWLTGNGMPLISWSAQSMGYFADDFDAEGNGKDSAYTFDSAQNRERRRRAFELAAKRDCSAAQIALAWVLNQPMTVIALVGARLPDHLRAALAAAQMTLTPDELAWLEVGGPQE
jgi:aryl-alcohol dehydrogenase-like predicted oxidoreductase